MNLTQAQYIFLVTLSQTLPDAFSSAPEEGDEPWSPELSRSGTPKIYARKEEEDEGDRAIDLLPELPDRIQTGDGEVIKLWTKMDVAFHVKSIIMELFDAAVTDAESLQEHSLARFTLNRIDLRFKSLSNDAMEAELRLRSFTIRDTHMSRQTKHRDIVPAAKHDSHQFLLSYTQSGGAERSAVANLTIDSPTFIFTLEPLFALSGFASSAFGGEEKESGKDEQEALPEPEQKVEEDASVQPWLTYRVNIVSPTIMLLADPTRKDSDAVSLTIDQVLLSQQSALLCASPLANLSDVLNPQRLSVAGLGIFLCQMNSQEERIRLLNNFDLTVALDTSSRGRRSMTSVDINIGALTARVSYRDIMLVMSIVNRATELAGTGQQPTATKALDKSTPLRDNAKTITSQRRRSSAATATARTRKQSKPQMQYISATEEVRSFILNEG